MKEGRRRIDIEEEWTKTNRLQATTSEKGFFSSRNHFPPFALAPTTFRAFSAEIARAHGRRGGQQSTMSTLMTSISNDANTFACHSCHENQFGVLAPCTAAVIRLIYHPCVTFAYQPSKKRKEKGAEKTTRAAKPPTTLPVVAYHI